MNYSKLRRFFPSEKCLQMLSNFAGGKCIAWYGMDEVVGTISSKDFSKTLKKCLNSPHFSNNKSSNAGERYQEQDSRKIIH